MPKENHYDLLKETYSIVGRIEDKLDKLETRVSTLEIWKAEIVGKCSVIIAGVSFAMTVGWTIIKERFWGK